jgi:hypothetical protein
LEAFVDEQNRLEKILVGAGYIVIFLPKFHPELNPIERFWAYLKRLAREVCDYSLKSLLELIPLIYAGTSVKTIRSHYYVAWAYLDAYNAGVHGFMSYRSLKKELRHRGVSSTLDEILQANAREVQIDSDWQSAVKESEKAVFVKMQAAKSSAIKGYGIALNRLRCERLLKKCIVSYALRKRVRKGAAARALE